jgi:hypothetical protein
VFDNGLPGHRLSITVHSFRSAASGNDWLY